jgi:hypothetical protein
VYSTSLAAQASHLAFISTYSPSTAVKQPFEKNYTKVANNNESYMQLHLSKHPTAGDLPP